MLNVLKAGFYTTIQDKGRLGLASKGVPISGAMDAYSADLANSILNNALTDAVLEITFGSCAFQFLEPTLICICGGDFSPQINNTSINIHKRILIQKGDVLSFGKVNYGVRCYLAVKGGFLSEIKLNSRSYYLNITKNTKINKEDKISYVPFTNPFKTSTSAIKVHKTHFNSKIVECYKGPEFSLLGIHQQKQITSQTFTISVNNSRMGYKINEDISNNLPQILTSAVLVGTVQLTPSGKLIILMRDCQVTGGYPRILQLTDDAINKLAQKTTRHSFQFSIISI